jgi:hypothetical protein
MWWTRRPVKQWSMGLSMALTVPLTRAYISAPSSITLDPPLTGGRGGGAVSADLAIVGVRVRTMDPELPRASAVAIRDGVIVTVGDDAEVRRECTASTRLVNGSGLVLTPGLTDGHQHLVMGAEVAQGVDFDRVDSLDGVRSRLRGGGRRWAWSARDSARIWSDGATTRSPARPPTSPTCRCG